MDLLARHWLGTTVVVFATWGMFATSLHPRTPAIFPLVVAWLFLCVWLLRGFIRFCGRAWRHGTVDGK
jgi:hypothetical protein